MLLTFSSVLLVTTLVHTTMAGPYESRDIRGRLFEDTLSVSSRLYPTKVRADDGEEPEPRRFVRHKAKEIRGAETIPIGEISEHDTKSFPVGAGYSVHEDPPYKEGLSNQGHKGLVFDDASPYNSRKYQGFSLDDYIKSVTNPGLRQATTPEPKPLLSDVKSILRNDDSFKQSFGEKSKTKTTKYVADFDNAFILPDDKVPPYGIGSNIEIVKAPKIGKKNRKQAEYLKDYNIKDIQFEHERQLDELDSFAKRKPGSSSTTDFNFGEIGPYGKAKPVSKTTTPKIPTYNFKISTKPTKYQFQQLQGQASYNNGKYFENNPKSPRLSDFIQTSEDEKLETAVREALTHLRKSQRGRGRANAAASKLNPVKQAPGPGGPPGGPGGRGGPRRPRRPFNQGPAPVRVFNFNN